jgi:hypothetical protein
MAPGYLRWHQLRAMPLYMQFIVVLMVVYAAAMTVLSAVFALNGRLIAAVTLSIALFVWAFALVVVPSKLGPTYVTADE